MTLKTIIFDMGGTLIDYSNGVGWPDLEEPGFTAAYHTLQQKGVDLPNFAKFRDTGYEILPKMWRLAMEGQQNLKLVDMLTKTLQLCGITAVSAEWLTEASDAYETAVCARSKPMPHVHETMDYVKSQGYRIGLVSNTMFTGKAHKRDLDRFELSDYFETMLFSADANKWKPTPAPFWHVLAELGEDPETAVYIGDSVLSDVVGGQRAGMKSIHYYSSDHFPVPDDIHPTARIHSLTELPQVLAQLTTS